MKELIDGTEKFLTAEESCCKSMSWKWKNLSGCT